jgi:hypothetical protein
MVFFILLKISVLSFVVNAVFRQSLTIADIARFMLKMRTGFVDLSVRITIFAVNKV